MQTKIAAATRTLHSLFRLLNSEWGLNAKLEKQLYVACVISISDYEAEIWWNNQKSYLTKFRKLQNTALRKILSAFRTSSIEAMKIESGISSVKIQLDQKCKIYAVWVICLPEKHSIRKRTSISYSPQYVNELNLNLNASKYLDWNESNQNLLKKAKNCRKQPTQIYRVLNKVQNTLNSISEIEIPRFSKSWSQNIEYLTNLQTEFAKCENYENVNTHYRELSKITQNAKNIVIYTDASQSRKGTGIAAVFIHEPIICKEVRNITSQSTITEAKLQAIDNVITICSEKALEKSNIWIYMNSQMTLQRLNSKSNANSTLFDNIHQNLTVLHQKQCKSHIYWVSSHQRIIGNEKADELIKTAASKMRIAKNTEITIINFLKKQIRKEANAQWLKTWKISTKKRNQYRKHASKVNLDHNFLKELQKIDRLIFSTFIQLKMRHDYFKSYLHRMSQNDSNKCYEICIEIQTSKHLLLNCKHYRTKQRKLKEKA